MSGSQRENGKYIRIGASLIAAGSIGLAAYTYRDQFGDAISQSGIESIFSLPSGSQAETPDTSKWNEIYFPTELDGSKSFAMTIHNPEELQSTPTGLKELILFTDDKNPIIGIAAIYDPTKAKIRGSKFRLVGFVGFQEITDPFVLNPRAIRGIDRSVIGQKEVFEFGIRTTATLDRLKNGGISRRELPFTLQVRPWPNPGTPVVIVFDESIVEFDGKPSPAMFLKKRFVFDNPNRINLPPASSV